MLDNLKSKYILKEILEKIHNKRKLNIIKYNKIIKAKLNINKEDFEIYITLKEFNNKYKTNIEDIDIREINLSRINIENEGLKDLAKIKFKELNKLDLSYNRISDISILEKVNFKELKELNLSKNNISDIKVLTKAKIKKLYKDDTIQEKLAQIQEQWGERKHKRFNKHKKHYHKKKDDLLNNSSSDE